MGRKRAKQKRQDLRKGGRVNKFMGGFAERFFKLFFSLSVLIFTGSSPNAFKDFSIKLKKTWD